MGQKMVRFAQLGAARSRQDESIEVGEAGSKRPSSGRGTTAPICHVFAWSSTTEKSAHSKTHGITTWSFFRIF